MLRGLRAQVQEALGDIPTRRRPALRRCDDPEALLATDLPFLADEAQVQQFRDRMTRLGWRTECRDGWILLDAPVPEPDSPVPDPCQGECGCCISLLLRHPGDAPAQEAIRALAKAAEAGRPHVERLCGQLHAALAARLRRHESLPGALLPYLCCAYEKISSK